MNSSYSQYSKNIKACALPRETIVLQVENAILQKLWKWDLKYKFMHNNWLKNLMREKWSKYLFPIRFKQMIEIITFVETERQLSFNKTQAIFFLSPSSIHLFSPTLICVERNYLGFLIITRLKYFITKPNRYCNCI